MTAVIMAGGKGTRIASVNSALPKPMLPLRDRPILEHQIRVLKNHGIDDFILCIGYLGQVIRDYFGDGAALGVKVRYITEEEPLGTAGAMVYLKEMLEGDFLLLNGDILFDIDLARFLAAHRRFGGLCTIFTHPNSHPYDSGIIETDEAGKVVKWLHKEDERLWYQNRVNAGLHLFSYNILERFTQAVKTDLDRDVLKPLIPEGQLYAYDSPEYVKDIGTPDRLEAAGEDLYNGIVQRRNLASKQRAIFLDRDGTLNKYVGFLSDINKFELIDGAGEAVRMINRAGHLAVVVTNQPAVARGELSLKGLRIIHNKMETLLGQQGAYLDAVYFCPHHPDKGFEGERPEYKIDCECRKPKPGMLLKAAERFNIDLAASWMVGDSDADMEAGRSAGCKTARIRGAGSAGEENTWDSLLAFAESELTNE